MSLPNLHNLDSPKTVRRRLLFLTVVALAAVFWLAYLPRLAQRPGFVEAFYQVESQGVDPGALFYTDHPRALTDEEPGNIRTRKPRENGSPIWGD